MFSKSLIRMAAGVLALAAVWSAPAAATPVNGTLTLNANGNIQFTATGGATVPTFTGLSFAPSGNQFNAAGGSLDLAVFTGTSGTISDFTYLPSVPLASFVIISGSTALTFDLATVSVFTPPNGWTQTANAESGAFLLQLDGVVKVTGFDDTFATIFLTGTQTIIRNPRTNAIILDTNSWSGTLTASGEPVRTPEPATLALIGTGLAGMGALRRRRKAA
jgi:hypothetical protein